MKTLEKSQDRVDKIASKLKNEVLEPAKVEAEELIALARQRAEAIIEEARLQSEQMHAAARAEIERERNVFQSSLLQAATQTMESLRQSVEKKLFNEELVSLVEGATAKADVVADFIKAVVGAIEKEGVEANLEVSIPKAVSVEDVNRLIGAAMLKRLKDGTVNVSTIAGGAQVKLVGKHMTIDISSDVLQKLMGEFLRKDYREFLFSVK